MERKAVERTSEERKEELAWRLWQMRIRDNTKKALAFLGRVDSFTVTSVMEKTSSGVTARDVWTHLLSISQLPDAVLVDPPFNEQDNRFAEIGATMARSKSIYLSAREFRIPHWIQGEINSENWLVDIMSTWQDEGHEADLIAISLDYDYLFAVFEGEHLYEFLFLGEGEAEPFLRDILMSSGDQAAR